jgi:hypothetical protein
MSQKGHHDVNTENAIAIGKPFKLDAVFYDLLTCR